MKRTTCLAYLGALLLLAGGCFEHPLAEDASFPPIDETPSAVVPDPQPAYRATKVPARSDILQRWELPASSPWLVYEKRTLLSFLAETPSELRLPEVEELEEVKLAELAADAVAATGLPRDAAWIVDLQGAASVAFATTLSHKARDPIAAVPTFNNWPALDEVVPAEETLAAMVAMPPAPAPPSDVAPRPIFLLDSWRLAFKAEELDDDAIDNRYMLTQSDFPSASALQAQGIHQVIYVVACADVEMEEDDLNDLFASYTEQGIQIHMIDLATLARVREPGEDPWYVELPYAHPFVFRPRSTVVHDPCFYRRSPGGFGGASLVPIRVGGGGFAWFGPGGGGG